MSYVTVINVVVILLVCVVSTGTAQNNGAVEEAPPANSYRRTSSYRRSSYRQSPSYRRTSSYRRNWRTPTRSSSSSSSGKKSLFHRIMSRVQTIRNEGDKKHDAKKWSKKPTTSRYRTSRYSNRYTTRRSTVPSTTQRYRTRRYTTRRASSSTSRSRYRYTRTRRVTPTTSPKWRRQHQVRRTSTRRVTPARTHNNRQSSGGSKKKLSLFDRIMGRVTQIRNQESGVSTRIVPKKPTRKTYRRKPSVDRVPVERVPVERVPVERVPVERISVKRVPVENAPVKRVPVERVPVERVPVKRVPIERTPTERKTVQKVTPAESKPKKKLSLFERIMGRVSQIRNNAQTNVATKKTDWRKKTPSRPGVGIVEKAPVVVPVVRGRSSWKPHTCLRTGCKMSSGISSNNLDSYLKRSYRGDKKKMMKVATWNIFEGKTPRNRQSSARREMCGKLKLMDATVFAFQDASSNQIREIERCLTRIHYTKIQGRYLYDSESRSYLYNPIFIRKAHGPSMQKISDGTVQTYVNRRSTPVATFTKVRFQPPKTTTSTPTRRKKNNIKSLWKRLNTIYNNVHSGRGHASAKSGPKGTELLIVNVKLIGNKAEDHERQIKNVLSKIRSESGYWRLPVVFMGDIKSEDNGKPYKAVYELRKFDNVFDTHINRNTHPMMTAFKKSGGERLNHHVFESKLNPVFAATLNDRMTVERYRPFGYRPVFAAFQMP